MSRFDFYKDRKFTEWERYYYSVEANSYEEAKEKIITDEVDWSDCKTLYNTMEYIDPSENYNCATVELYDSNTDDLVADNLEYENL